METGASRRLRAILVLGVLLAGTACGRPASEPAAPPRAPVPNATPEPSAPGPAVPAPSPATTSATRPAPSSGPANQANPATGSPISPASRATASPPPKAPQLPRGGRTVFPRYRLVGFAGAPGSAAFGRLGIGNLDARGKELQQVARPYAAGRQVLPVFELIATVANSGPGRDGKYRTRTDDATIRRYLGAARRAKAVLLLGIQPGRANFLPEVKAYEKWLREPDVGLALDPEWAVDPGQVPGRVFGRTSGKELDAVARYVAGLVATRNLPEKVMVFHQLALPVVRDQGSLKAHRGVVLIKSVDGIGSKSQKLATWRRLTAGQPRYIHAAFKLFYEEDRERGGQLMRPAEVLTLRPTPEYVLYE